MASKAPKVVARKTKTPTIAHADTQVVVPSIDGEWAFDAVAALDHLRGADPTLAALIDKVGAFAMELKNAPTLFAALAEAIVYQQLTGKAAATIHARVVALFPSSRAGLTPKNILGASDEALRSAGLSRSKLLSLRDFAQKAIDGDVPTLAETRRMADEEIIARLTHVRGIGRWTAQMLLIFHLGRGDVLPVDDYGVRKGYAVAFRKRELPKREAIEKRAERWRPYRSVASWYLWRAAENTSTKTKPQPRERDAKSAAARPAMRPLAKHAVRR